MMTKTIEVSGKTEDEAIEAALEQLGLTRDDVSVEIVERAKTGFLGLKNTPAIVKVIYEASEADAVYETGVDRTEQTQKAGDFIKGLLERMDVDADMDITEKGGTVNVTLKGNDPGSLIGRRGETLDSIQHLTNYVVNRGNSGRLRVNIDAENYRQRRNDTLETLATKTAGKVVKYRRNLSLDPMNAYERHVIHTALQDYENISTYSVGSEPNRRIVVAYDRGGGKTGRPPSGGTGGNGGSGGGSQQRTGPGHRSGGGSPQRPSGPGRPNSGRSGSGHSGGYKNDENRDSSASPGDERNKTQSAATERKEPAQTGQKNYREWS